MTTAGELQRHARAARESTALRDKAVVRMRAEGASLRTIAAVAGLSPSGVQRVLDRGDPEAAG